MIHMIVINHRTTHFVSAKSISVKYNFPFQILSFLKSPNVTKRSVSEESAFKKSKNPSAFFSKNYKLN